MNPFIVLEILTVFLSLKFLSSLILNEVEGFSKVLKSEMGFLNPCVPLIPSLSQAGAHTTLGLYTNVEIISIHSVAM